MIGSYTAPKEHGILVVFSGPSGAGKGTILKRYFEDDPPAVLSVSATTRAPRPGEVDGVHYHFISRAEFEQLIANDGVLEYNIYNGNYYGSPRGPIEEELSKGHDVILEIETNGAISPEEAIRASGTGYVRFVTRAGAKVEAGEQGKQQGAATHTGGTHRDFRRADARGGDGAGPGARNP